MHLVFRTIVLILYNVVIYNKTNLCGGGVFEIPPKISQRNTQHLRNVYDRNVSQIQIWGHKTLYIFHNHISLN